jgi:hypothetical protein
VSARAGLDDLEKRIFLTLQGLELRSLGRPVSLYTDCARARSLAEICKGIQSRLSSAVLKDGFIAVHDTDCFIEGYYISVRSLDAPGAILHCNSRDICPPKSFQDQREQSSHVCDLTFSQLSVPRSTVLEDVKPCTVISEESAASIFRVEEYVRQKYRYPSNTAKVSVIAVTSVRKVSASDLD